MLRRLLPASVAVAEGALEAFAARGGVAAERELADLGRAVPARVREFRAGRACAHEALSALGVVSDAPIGIGPKREPCWPAGVAGSITHGAGHCAAAVTSQLRGVGIDVESAEPLPPEVIEMVLDAEERAHLARLPGDGTPWDRVVFSAKESLYKAWYPLTQAWLGFEHARATLDPQARTVRLELLHARDVARARGLPRVWEGRYACGEGRIYTALVVD